MTIQPGTLGKSIYEHEVTIGKEVSMTTYRKELIEEVVPLEAISCESAERG